MTCRIACVYQVAGTVALLRPDVVGQYTVIATIVTTSSGIHQCLTQTITAGTYMGVNTCALCHSGGASAPRTNINPGKPPPTRTSSPTASTAYLGSYSPSCLKCHTVGYDANTNAIAPSTAGLTMSPHRLAGPSRRCWPPPTGRTCRPCIPALPTWPIFSARTATARAASTPTPSATPISSPRRSSPATATNAMTPRRHHI